MLFTNRDMIRAYIRREKAKAGLEIAEEDDAQEEVEEAHKDVVRHCIYKMTNQTAVKHLGDIQEMVDVWMNFVKNNKRFQIVQNRFTG